MAGSRDDDLDWLYGREPKSDPEPEPTRVLPPVTADAGPAGVPPGHSGRSGQSGRPRPPAGQPISSDAPTGPRPTAAQPAVPADPRTAVYGPVHPGTPGDSGPGGGGPGGGATGGGPGKRRPARRVRRVLVLVLVLAVVGLLAIPVLAWSQIARVDDSPSGDRPADQPGTTFLMVGSDSREGLTKAEKKKLGTGSTAGQRTDTVMLMHIPPGGKPALISIPRDSYVSVPKHGRNKINAAYSFGGPELLVRTVEQNTGLRIDGYLEVGFGGFVNVIDALGGIEMCLPKAIKDRNSHLDLPEGCQELSGADALGYVRMRYADPKGDLGRVARQRQMLAAVAKKAAAPATVLNPIRYWRLWMASADALKLGEDTSAWEMAKLARAMTKVSGPDGYTLTVPIANPNLPTPVGSAVQWDRERALALFRDLARGDTSDLAKYTD